MTFHEFFIDNKKRFGLFQSALLMREMGLEPTRPIGHKILSLACLPIPALPHIQFAVGDYLANR